MNCHRLSDGSRYPDDWTLTDELWGILQSPPAEHAFFRFLEQGKDDRECTQRAIVEQAARVAQGLIELGLHAGDQVAVILPENEDFLRGFLAAVLVGMVPVPLFPPLGFGGLDAYVERNARILQACGARVLVTSKRLQNVLWSLTSDVDSLERIVCIEDLQPTEVDLEHPPRTPEDLCFLQYTSGSTAAPKGVMVSHRSLGANLYAIVHHGLHVRAGRDVAVSWLPLFHDMGLIGMTFAPLATGVSVNFIPALDFVMYPECWLGAISERRGTVTFAPNFAYALATRKIPDDQVAQLDLSSLRVAGCGAEPIHPQTMRAFVEHFRPAGLRPEALLPAYGMAEATLAVSFIGVDETVKTDRVDAKTYEEQDRAEPVAAGFKAGSRAHREPHEFVCCGRPFPGHHLTIVDDNGNPLGDREVGEIVLDGPSVTEGYYHEPELTQTAFENGRLHTGDLGYIADGELYVTGRKKDLIIINGRNFDPQTIEWKASEVAGVRKGNVVAFSMRSEESEELVVVAETHSDVDRDQIERDIKRVVSRELFVKVSHVELVSKATLPKTSSGKLQRAKAKQQFLEGEIGKSMRAANRSVDVTSVSKHVARSMVNRMRHFVHMRMVRMADALRSIALPG